MSAIAPGGEPRGNHDRPPTQTSSSVHGVTIWSWVLAVAAVVLAVISALGLNAAQSAVAIEPDAADISQLEAIGPLLVVGAAVLATLVVVAGMITTLIVAAVAQGRGRGPVLGRSALVMGLVVSLLVWTGIIVVW